MAKKFSANKLAQPIYDLVHQTIKDLSNERAIEVLEEISSHLDGQVEAMREEMEDLE